MPPEQPAWSGSRMLAAEHRRGPGLPFDGKRYCLSLQDLPNVAKATVQIEYVLPYPETKNSHESVSPHTNGKVGLSVIQPVKARTAPT